MINLSKTDISKGVTIFPYKGGSATSIPEGELVNIHGVGVGISSRCISVSCADCLCWIQPSDKLCNNLVPMEHRAAFTPVEDVL